MQQIESTHDKGPVLSSLEDERGFKAPLAEIREQPVLMHPAPLPTLYFER